MSLHSLTQTRRSSQVESESPTIVFPICANPLLRLGLETILSDSSFIVWPDMIDDPSSLPDIQDETPLLFVIDGNSRAEGVLDLIRHLKARSPMARMVILADRFELDMVSAAWEAGAHGFCLSSQRDDVLVKALELVMLGEVVLPSALLPSMAEEVDHSRPPSGAVSLSRGTGFANERLSNREAEILSCLREGAPNKVIARKLNLSESTVKVHVKSILKKIGVCNRTQAALWANRHATRSADLI